MRIADCVLCTDEFETDDEDAVACERCAEDDPEAVLQAKVDVQSRALPVWLEDGFLFDIERLRDREMQLSQED